MSRTFTIDCFPESAARYPSPYAVVAIDVIRATTTATTAMHLGRRVFPARGSDDALVIAASLDRPLLVGELGGNMCDGFDITNSPVRIEERTDTERPMVLVSSSGTQLILGASETASAVFLACLRNYSAVAEFLAQSHEQVAVIGAGTRGQFRREDQIGCARVGERLLELGYRAADAGTLECIERWRGVPLDVIRQGRSADYLRRSQQEHDLEFVLSHIDDVTTVPWLATGELVDASRQVAMATAARPGVVWERESIQ
jgi:2-phosphosulfolactate phosphatase